MSIFNFGEALAGGILLSGVTSTAAAYVAVLVHSHRSPILYGFSGAILVFVGIAVVPDWIRFFKRSEFNGLDTSIGFLIFQLPSIVFTGMMIAASVIAILIDKKLTPLGYPVLVIALLASAIAHITVTTFLTVAF
jgi:hypothetical protein